jgi:hypothetical protein
MNSFKKNKSKKLLRSKHGGGLSSSIRRLAHWISNTTPKPISAKQRKRLNIARRKARTKSLYNNEKKTKKNKTIKTLNVMRKNYTM